MTNSIRVGVIGVGGMGARHARNLTHHVVGAHMTAVMDIDPVRAKAIAAECGDAQPFSDASALIADPDVDAVVIVSPDATHAPLTLECLAAGKSVLCEKPLATTLADAKKVLDAEVAGGHRLVQIGLMRVYDPPHISLKQMLDKGEIGHPLMFRGVHNNLSLGFDRTTEEVIINSAVHDIHSARWLMSEEIESVYVRRVAANPDRPETCRLLVIQLTFRNGALGQIEVNSDSGYGYEVLVEITGEKGLAHTLPLQSPTVRRSGLASQKVEADWLVRFETAYIHEVQVWIGSLLAETPTGPSVWDGYVSQVVANACVQSAQTGAPQAVPILEPPALYRER